MIRKLLFSLFILINGVALCQEDCYLGVGGKDDKTIIEVFQLTEEQTENLRNWSAELDYRNSLLQDQAKALLKKHAQSSPEDLLAMSYQFQDLLDSMRSNMRMIDKRVLSMFNNEQYNLYMQLCNTVARSPIFTSRPVNEK